MSTMPAQAGEPRLVVDAGDWERRQTLVTADWPKEYSAYRSLRDSDGGTIPIQMNAAGHASFILPALARGAAKTYELVPAPPSAGPDADEVQAKPEGGVLKLTAGGRPVLQYQADKGELPRPDIKPIFARGGFLHPILSPSGKLVSDSYPPNHLHHHGIWSPWTKAIFEGRATDFWNMGEGKGTVEFVALDATWSGPVHAGFQARHRFVDLTAPEPRVALHETWVVQVYRAGGAGSGGAGSGSDGHGAVARPYWIFDLSIRQECAGPSPLKLPKYHYGGLGFRGNREWDGKGNAFVLTSEGVTDRLRANESRARWCHIGGQVEGQLTGLAILDHPTNFRAPQPMRIHPTEPFFCYAPSQLGDWAITPEQPYAARYRFIVQDGPPDKAELDRLWNDYAHPPSVRFEAK